MANTATERINKLGKRILKAQLPVLYHAAMGNNTTASEQWRLWKSLNNDRKRMVKSWLGKGRTGTLSEALVKIDLRIKRDHHQI